MAKGLPSAKFAHPRLKPLVTPLTVGGALFESPRGGTSTCRGPAYKVTRGPHYDADATIAVPELNFTSYFLRKVS